MVEQMKEQVIFLPRQLKNVAIPIYKLGISECNISMKQKKNF